MTAELDNAMDDPEGGALVAKGESDDHDDALKPTTSASVTLSKSWSIASSHAPTFTGGKVTHSHTTTERRIGVDDVNDFLLLPVGGDLAIVDARRGVKVRSLREGVGGLVGNDKVDDDQDDDDGIDAEAITSYALSWNDQMLLTVSRNQLLRQYSMNSTSPSWSKDRPAPVKKTWGRTGHTLPVTHMEFHKSNVFVATGSVDGTVRVWDVRGAYVTHVFRPIAATDSSSSGGMHAVTALTWRKDVAQLVLAVGRDDGSIVIHDLRDETNVIVLRDHVSAVMCMEWSTEMEHIFISSGRDAVVNTWQIVPSNKKKKIDDNTRSSYKRIHTMPVYEQVEGMTILHSNDNNTLLVATAGSKGIVRLWSASASSNCIITGFTCVAEQSSSEAFGSERGGYMGINYVTRFHSEGKDDESIPASREQLIVPDAEHNLSFLTISGRDRDTPSMVLGRTIVGHNDEILDLKVIPQGKDGNTANVTRIAVATNSAQVRLFELDTFSCDLLDGHTATVLCVDISPCGRYLATCGKDKTMRIWHLGSQRCVAVATGHTEAVGAAALSRKVGKYEVVGKAATNGGGSFAVTASKDRTLKRWNLPGASEMDSYVTSKQSEIALDAFTSVRAHEKDINIVSIAPNDSLISTGSQDKTIKLWRSTDLSLKATLKGHRRGVWDCQFSPFDRVLASSSGDRTIKLWSLGDCSCVRTFQGHVASALRVRFLSGGLQLVSSGADGLIKLWTIRTNECETTMDGHINKVWALDLSTDGTTLVSGGADSQIVVWKDTTQAEDEANRAVKEQNIMMEQKLSNHLRHKEYEQALEVALELEKPMQALKVFNSIVENDVEKGCSGLETLQRHVQNWPMDRTTQVLRYCRDWNTRARNSHIAMLVIKAIVTTIPAQNLATNKEIPELLAGITPYAERHYTRLDNLYTSSYLLEFVLFSMGSLDVDDIEVSKAYTRWEATSQLVLPPKRADGRIQVGGSVGLHRKAAQMQEDDADEVLTIGSSDTSDDEDDGGSVVDDESPLQATRYSKADPDEVQSDDGDESDSSSSGSDK